MPGELVRAEDVTKRSSYAGSVRSSRVAGGSRSWSANQVSSTLTQTSPTSTGTIRSAPSPSRAYRSAPSGSLVSDVGEDALVERARGEGVVDAEGHVAGRVVRGEHQLGGQRAGVAGGPDLEVVAGLLLERADQLLGQGEVPVGDEDDGVVGRGVGLAGGVAAGQAAPGQGEEGRGDGERERAPRGDDGLHADSLSPVLTGSGSEGLRWIRTLSTPARAPLSFRPLYVVTSSGRSPRPSAPAWPGCAPSRCPSPGRPAPGACRRCRARRR